MILRDAGVVLAVVLGLALTGYLYSRAVGKDDTEFEEAIEEVIKSKTGADIDLTPGSDEQE